MKEKVIVTTVLTMLLVGAMLSILPTLGFDGQIKIGIIGPVGLTHYSPGMKEAAEMARDEINTAGGVHLSDGDYEIVLEFGNDHTLPPPGGDPDAAALEMERLIDVEGCEVVIGGFRTECVETMIEVAADYGIPFIINGASTDQLITDTVGADYERYKYLFRINPVNSTVLFQTIAANLRYYIIPQIMLPLYGHDLDGNAATPDQVRIAVLTEDLEWTLLMHTYLTNPAIYPGVLGPNVNVTYSGRIPDGTMDCSPWLQGVKDNNCRLMIHVFSGVTGIPLMVQWKAMNVSAVPVGINVLSQVGTNWATTGGACNYETFLGFSGTRSPIVPGVTEVFWDNFVALTGEWPVYTAWGAYDGVYMVAEAMEATGTKDKDALLAYLEDPGYERQGLNGKFRFTSLHDVFCNEVGPTWTQGFVRAMLVQWQATKMEVVIPIDQTYTKAFVLPYWEYPHTCDTNYDAKVDIKDLVLLIKAYGTYPCHPRWTLRYDVNPAAEDSPPWPFKVDIKDLVLLIKEYGTYWSLPLP